MKIPFMKRREALSKKRAVPSSNQARVQREIEYIRRLNRLDSRVKDKDRRYRNEE